MIKFNSYTYAGLSLTLLFSSFHVKAGNIRLTLEKEDNSAITHIIQAVDHLTLSSDRNFNEAINISKAIALDNMTWIEGLYDFWSKPDNRAVIEHNISTNIPSLENNVLQWSNEFFLHGSRKEKEEWKLLLSKLEKLEKTDDDLSNLLNNILDWHIIQEREWINITSVRDNCTLKMAHYYPGNEENTRAQASSLKDILTKLLPFSSSQYQRDFNELSLEIIEGNNNYIIPEKKNSFLEFNMGCHLATRYKFKLPLLKKLKLTILNHFQLINSMNIQSINIKFIESNLEITFLGLQPSSAQKYIDDYNNAKIVEEKINKIKSRKNKNNNFVTSTTSSSITDTRNIDDLLEDICGKSVESKKKKDIKEKKSKKKKGKAQLLISHKVEKAIDYTIIPDTSSASFAEPPHPLLSENINEASNTNNLLKNTTGNLSISPTSAGSFTLPEDLKEKTLRLAANQHEGHTFPLITINDSKTNILKAHHKNMLANLLKVNKNEMYGDLKASHMYNWNDLVGLLKSLGFTVSKNHLFTFSSAQQIRLHYLHYDDKRLNEDLLGIMFKQLDNIGFTKEYLIEFLKR